MKPEISIIVPVHNLDPFIGKCLDSILAQTYTNFEVIVVNDGSTDGSGNICDVYAMKDERIKVFHIKYGGVSVARNVGVDAAQGNYIGFVDGDDYIDEKMYEMLYQYCLETTSDIAICQLGREIDGTLINRNKADDFCVKELNHLEAMRQLFKGILYRFSLCNKLFKKSCFKGVIFPDNRIHEDLSTTYRLFANANKTVYVNYVGYIYVKRKDSILASIFNRDRLDAFNGWNEILKFMREHYHEIIRDVYACYGFWCVDSVYYVLNQVINKKEKREYLITIQKSMNGNYKDLIINKGLPFKYRYIVFMINYNLCLLVLSHRFKKTLSEVTAN